MHYEYHVPGSPAESCSLAVPCSALQCLAVPCSALQFCLSCRGSALGLELALANRALELRTGDAAAAVLWRVQQVSSFDVDHRASKQLPVLLVNLRKQILHKGANPTRGQTEICPAVIQADTAPWAL